MAHQHQQEFCLKVKNKYPEYFKNKKVLDIGSLDINGNNRVLFEDCNYLGLDVGMGKNVDYISVGHLFEGPDNYYDTIISTEVFEHDMFYEDTIKNIMRMLKPGGLFLFTCAAPGRDEHGTRRTGGWCAPLLLQISEEWSDYYKNLTDTDFKKINGFNECFPDGVFELYEYYVDRPCDLYFYGFKGGEKYLVHNIEPEFNKEEWSEHIFVIDSWPDNESKENDLLKLIKLLKKYNIEILLVGHYAIKPEIQKMVDYYIFDKKNPLLLQNEFEAYSFHSGRWSEMYNCKIENKLEFHHDYAIWETMRSAFNYCKFLNKKYIHFLEYDNIPDFVQYRQSFLEKIKNFEFIIYEYQTEIVNNQIVPYCATYIFSIHTDLAVKTIDTIKNKWEYFTNKPRGWQLERVFFDKLKNFTDNIHKTEYIPNNNEFNTQAVWNRDGINRNGAKIQIYLVADQNQDLYIHLISGFHSQKTKENYLLEINYMGFNKFVSLYKDNMIIEKIGKYVKGSRVYVYNNAINIFDEFLGKDFDDFYFLNKLTWKNLSKANPKGININFIDGPYVHINDSDSVDYRVEFIDKKYNKLIYSNNIKGSWWSKSTKTYNIDWRIKITGNEFEYIHDLNFENKKVLISFESKSLGDTLAWIPYVEKFRLEKKCNVVCSTFHNSLFKEQYKEIEFCDPGSVVHNLYAHYRLGLFKKDNKVDYDRHPSNPLKEPLTKIASDILGLEYEELKPRVKQYAEYKTKTVTIATHSTAQCKYWNNPTGWQDIVDYLKEKGYEVILLSREEDGYMGNKNPSGVIQHPPGDIEKVIKVIQESSFFIGLSSGLSWLAWACNIPTVLISGFTDDDLEPKDGIIRVINKNVCNGCWSRHDFDPGDWNWCPEHKGTERQFECSKQITSNMVIEKIQEII